MIYNEYGSTGKSVSAIGFGGMRFEKPDDTEVSAKLIIDAYNLGVNYFDTAPGYGKSEDLYGAAFKTMLKTRAEKPFHVSTKTFGGNPSEVRRDLEKSLSRMGLDSVDFYHSWCLMSFDEYVHRRDNGVYREFEKLKDEGLIKHICVSTHMDGAEIAKMLEDYPHFEGVLLGYSAMNFAYREKGVEAAAKRNMGVVVMNPLGGGVIPQNPDRFAFLKTQRDETVVEAALRFLLNDRRITLPLVGMANTAQLEEAIHAVEGFVKISDRRIEELRKELSSSMNSLCTNCGYCAGCPMDVPIAKLMDAYNHYLLAGKNEKALVDRLRWHWGIDAESGKFLSCSDCGRCEELCTQKLPIPERIREIRRILRKASEEAGASK